MYYTKGLMKEDNNVRVTFVCPVCSQQYDVVVTYESLRNYYLGKMNAQTAFAGCDATTREHFISGICTACQNAIFDEDEERGKQ